MYSVTLHNQQQATQVLSRLAGWMKPRLMAGRRLRLSIGDEQRNLAQNAKLHAIIGEIAAQKEWAGQRWEAETWKRLLTSAWMRANGEHVLVVPALDGAGVDVVFRPTSRLTKAECSDLLEYVSAWAAQHGVQSAHEEP